MKANSFPDVDSRPALLGPRSLEKCTQFLLRVAWAATPGNLDIIPRALRIWQLLLTVSVLRQKSFFLCQTQEGWRRRRES